MSLLQLPQKRLYAFAELGAITIDCRLDAGSALHSPSTIPLGEEPGLRLAFSNVEAEIGLWHANL